MMMKSLLIPAIMLLCASFSVAQETITLPATVTDVKVVLSENGQFSGQVVTDAALETATVSEAKVTLSADGKVIDSVTADAEGNFSFANVAPGAYTMAAVSGSMFGSHPVTVEPFAAAAVAPAAPVQIALEPVQFDSASPIAYDQFAGAPLSSCDTCNAPAVVSSPCGGSACGSCNTCGGGLGGGIAGGRIGGRLGGGLLGGGGSRIGLVGLAGLAGLAGIDSSPDQ